MMNRTKIVATIGPASRTPEVLRQLIDAGVDVFRLNFSHGTHEEHSAVLAHIRRISGALGQPVAVLQDLCGPKIRLEPIPGDILECRLHDEFTLVAGVPANERELACSYRNLPDDLAAGESVLFADGTVAGVSAAGTGLGLDIARRTAQSAGGGMRIERGPLGGARVRLDFAAPD